MKLLTKTTLNFLSVTLFIFLIGILAFYFLLRNQVDRNINFELEKRKMNIIKLLDSQTSGDSIPSNPNERIIIDVVDSKSKNVDFAYTDTLIFDILLNRPVPFRKLSFTTQFGNQKFHIQIFKSLEESDLLIVRIFLVLAVLVILLIVSLLLINRISLRQSWKIFYDTIKKLNSYKVEKHEQFTLQESDITEFNDLNSGIKSMTDRINADYINLKEYTEDASHEIQNPLAIISSKLELLIQSGELTEQQLKVVADAYEASNRLSRINKSLILLSKIENRQFAESEDLVLLNVINKQIDFLEDLIFAKNIKVIVDVNNNTLLNINPYLADVLFVNLLKNAIRHNVNSGRIEVIQKENQIVISNTGDELKINSEDLFRRFQKSSDSPESLGLGLSIVKKICEIYNFKISYSFDGMHSFTIILK